MITPHNYLTQKGYINTRGEIDGYTGSVIYSLPADVGDKICSILGLEVVPDLAVIKNGEVTDPSSAIIKQDDSIPFIYSLFFLKFFKEKHIAAPIHGERIICNGEESYHRGLAVNIMSSQDEFETFGGLYLPKRKVATFQQESSGKE